MRRPRHKRPLNRHARQSLVRQGPFVYPEFGLLLDHVPRRWPRCAALWHNDRVAGSTRSAAFSRHRWFESPRPVRSLPGAALETTGNWMQIKAAAASRMRIMSRYPSRMLRSGLPDGWARLRMPFDANESNGTQPFKCPSCVREYGKRSGGNLWADAPAGLFLARRPHLLQAF